MRRLTGAFIAALAIVLGACQADPGRVLGPADHGALIASDSQRDGRTPRPEALEVRSCRLTRLAVRCLGSREKDIPRPEPSVGHAENSQE